MFVTLRCFFVTRKNNKANKERILYGNNRTLGDAFVNAARNNECELVGEYLQKKRKVNVNGFDCDGWTALHAAAHEGYCSMVQKLIQAGADVHMTCHGQTALYVALKGGHGGVVHRLMDGGANVNDLGPESRGETALYLACEQGFLAAVERIIAAGVDVNGYCIEEETALYMALRKQYSSIARSLIKAGASVHRMHRDFDAQTLFYMACEQNLWAFVQILLAEAGGIDVNAAVPGRHSQTGLYVAAEQGHALMVGRLIQAGADVNLACHGETPLYVTLKRGYGEVAERLIQAGADVHHLGADTDNETALHIACEMGLYSVVAASIQVRANVNQSCHGNSPLYVAARRGNWRSVQKLIESGADLNSMSHGETALYIACQTGDVAVVPILVEAGSDLNMRCHGETALYVACKKGFLIVAQLLIEAGADVNLQSTLIHRKTPLLIACEKVCLPLAQILIQAGADVTFTCKGGKDGVQTALQAACRHGRCAGMVEELLKAGADVNQPSRDLDATAFSVLVAYWKPLPTSERLMIAVLLLSAKCTVDARTLLTAYLIPEMDPVFSLMVAAVENLTMAVDPDDNTALHLCILNNAAQWKIKVLLESGIDIDAQNKYGKTALHLAVESVHFDLIQLLLNYDASVSILDGFENTALTSACKLDTVPSAIQLSVILAIYRHCIAYGELPILFCNVAECTWTDS